MAANIQLGEGTSGKYSKTTEVSAGVHIGNVELVTSAGVEIAPLTDTQLRASAVPISVATIPSHAVTNAGTFATQVDGAALTALQLIDNCISGSEAQVDVVAALPAGDNNIGNVDIVSGTVTTVSTLTNQTQMGGQNISMGTGVRDAGTQRVTIATNDAVPVTDNGGTLTVDGTVAVTNAGITSIDGKITACNTGAVVLAAGTAGIGKLTANSGVDIGDVDVASCALPTGAATSAKQDTIITAVQLIDDIVGALKGPGSPTIDSYTQVAINLAAGNDQVLVSSAANKQIWVYGVTFTVNVAGTVSFQDEDNTAITGIMPFDAKGGMAVSPSGNFAMPLWKLATDKDLEVDIVTSEMDGYLNYALVSV